jgi:hypothetical protein
MSEERNFETVITGLQHQAGVFEDNSRTYAAVGNTVTAQHFAALREQALEAIEVLKEVAKKREEALTANHAKGRE